MCKTHIFIAASLSAILVISRTGSVEFQALESVTSQRSAVRADTARPTAGGERLLLYINLEAAAWWNVELANSKVLTVGVPSITFERVFNTSAYAVWS
jgi:hypothetical protein